MCFGGPDIPDSAAIQREAEAAKQAKINAGLALVNQEFSGFGEDFYGGLEKAYKGHYRPQIDEQRAEAQRAMDLSSPTRASSAYIRNASNLERDYQRELVHLGEGAEGYSADQRNAIEQRRQGLSSQIQGGLSLEDTAIQAAEAARINAAPRPYSPLADLFARYTNNFAQGAAGARAGYQPNTVFGGQNFQPSRGAVRNVN